MGLGIGLGDADFASFPAIRTVVFAVHAEADVLLPLAVAAVAVALARALRQVALRTENGDLHILASSSRRAAETSPGVQLAGIHYRTAQRAGTSCYCSAAQLHVNLILSLFLTPFQAAC